LLLATAFPYAARTFLLPKPLRVRSKRLADNLAQRRLYHLWQHIAMY